MSFTEAALKEAIERGYNVGLSTTGPLSVTGERYVVIGSQHPDEPLSSAPGTVDECRRAEVAFDEETAYFAALGSFQLYAEGRGTYLYWRSGPFLEWNDDHTRCRFYVRLLVSDKQPKNAAA